MIGKKINGLNGESRDKPSHLKSVDFYTDAKTIQEGKGELDHMQILTPIASWTSV